MFIPKTLRDALRARAKDQQAHPADDIPTAAAPAKSSDEAHAEAVRKAVQVLNERIAAAEDAGLRVEIEAPNLRVMKVDGKARSMPVMALVTRRL